MKKRILFYSDCFFFGGSENMLINFLTNKTFNEVFDTQFLYKYSKWYEEGMKERINTDKAIPINLVKELDPNVFITSNIKLIRKTQTLIFLICYLLLRYAIIAINTVRLYKKFKLLEFDILHINNGGYPAAYSCYSAIIAARLSGHKKIVYVVNNIAVGYRNKYRWLDWPLDKYVSKVVTIFITGSENAGKHLEEVLNIINKRITINNGIANRDIVKDKETYKRDTGIQKNKLVFGTVANLEKRKGHIFLFRAIRDLVAEGKVQDIIFVIVGDGPCREELEQFIYENSLGRYIWMVGWKDHIFDFYNILDVFILPSIADEDFPNTIIENMRLGVPSIASAIAGISEQIVDGETGLLVEPQNVEQLKSAIITLAFDGQLRSLMSCNSKERFKRKFSEEKSINNYIELYNRL